MFSKILVANRGEIACRIINTLDKMDIKSVAIFSEADTNSKHVNMASSSVNIGPAKAEMSYLNIGSIIQAALQEGVDAIHPGYGFLSENSEFSEAVESAGMTFIGPSSSSIKLMGLKDQAKKIMSQSKVPVVPGYNGTKQSEKILVSEAKKIGYPLMIKAIAGGGGKGMRFVKTENSFLELLRLAKSEALNAFGDNKVLLEKYIRNPRHVEVQVFGDRFGNIIHLFDRDCSLQRRHQKVIEEAPAPNIPIKVREKMHSAAVDAAKSINYVGAGTVEFICDCSQDHEVNNFWFMEMNTRLQVEHPITEQITGLDLVEWQIRVAAGEPLPKNQDKIVVNGHSMEARLYAEDPQNNFLPTTGIINHLLFPSDIRVDCGIRPGDQVSPFYDPLIAKIIVKGQSREDALVRLRQALIKTEISGCVTNLSFIHALSLDPQFADVHFDTQLIESKYGSLTKNLEVPIEIKVLASIAALGLADLSDSFSGFSLWEPMEMSVPMSFGKVFVKVCDQNNFSVVINENIFSVNRVGWAVNDVRSDAKILLKDSQISIFSKGSWYFEIKDPLNPIVEQNIDGNNITAPMPGFIKLVNVQEGEIVRKGDLIIVQEAMKMEHSLIAQKNGQVVKLDVEPGEQVEAGRVLVELGPISERTDG
ncbi:MAG: biotin carboxylase N-terminal domain-containing protein [Paracoccaceae bacterium]|nr:biotin carboxylase N-terminal domain-containing protein [Paracoccaceae bacterium]